MASIRSDAAFGGSLEARLLSPPKPHKARTISMFGRRVILTTDPGDATILGRDAFESHLAAVHRGPEGNVIGIHDMGSGNVQSNFVAALSQDQLGTGSNHAAPILANSGSRMWSGTTSTVNTYDYQLAATAGPASGAITPTLAFVANGTAGTDATIQYIGTIAYTTTLGIVEWGLFGANSQGALSTSTVNTNTATGTSASTWGVAPTGANAWAGYTVVATSASPVVGGFVIANSTGTTSSLITIGTGWYNLNSAGGPGSTPATNSTLGIYPLMTDHKSFSVINVVNGDSIQFTYTLKLVAGG